MTAALHAEDCQDLGQEIDKLPFVQVAQTGVLNDRYVGQLRLTRINCEFAISSHEFVLHDADQQKWNWRLAQMHRHREASIETPDQVAIDVDLIGQLGFADDMLPVANDQHRLSP